LDADSLNEITRSFYSTENGFESEEFNIHQGLWHWEADAIQERFVNCKRVLVAGAGGGREVIALARFGFEVTGFDFSHILTKACRDNLEKAGCHACVLDEPPDEVPAGLNAYDALLIGRGFYHHIPGRMRRIKFLESCCRYLPIGAPVILSDFFTRPDGMKFYRRTQSTANFVRGIRNSTEQVELGDWLSNCMQHVFIREEIEQELLTAGIKPEIYWISPFSDDSRLAHILGRIL